MIKIKNKEYKFKFGFKALIHFEDHTGKSVSELGENIGMSNLVDIAYCGLISQGEKVTRDFIIDAIDEDPTLITTFTEAMTADMAAFSQLNQEAKK